MNRIKFWGGCLLRIGIVLYHIWLFVMVLGATSAYFGTVLAPLVSITVLIAVGRKLSVEINPLEKKLITTSVKVSFSFFRGQPVMNFDWGEPEGLTNTERGKFRVLIIARYLLLSLAIQAFTIMVLHDKYGMLETIAFLGLFIYLNSSANLRALVFWWKKCE